jgi:hypothetical protein
VPLSGTYRGHRDDALEMTVEVQVTSDEVDSDKTASGEPDPRPRDGDLDHHLASPPTSPVDGR